MKTLETLKLHDLLRYFLSGGFFLIAYMKVKIANFPILNYSGLKSPELIVFTIVALLVGTTVYVVHRALIYPIMGRVAFWLAGRRLFKVKPALFWPYKPFPFEAEITRKHWQMASNNMVNYEPFLSSMTEWGAQVHFLYCAGLSLSLGNFFGLGGYWPFQLPYDPWILFGAISLFVAGLVSDYRAWVHELDVSSNIVLRYPYNRPEKTLDPKVGEEKD